MVASNDCELNKCKKLKNLNIWIFKLLQSYRSVILNRGTLGCRELVIGVPPVVTIPSFLYIMNQLWMSPVGTIS